jgi:hypothetical protein
MKTCRSRKKNLKSYIVLVSNEVDIKPFFLILTSPFPVYINT